MASHTFLMTKPQSPLEALNEALQEQGHLLAEHVAFAAFEATTFLSREDNAWAWQLLPGAPRVVDMGGTAFIRESSTSVREATVQERPGLHRGVVIEKADYGGYLVAFDTGEGETDETLVEYAIGVL